MTSDAEDSADLVRRDRATVWHPYASVIEPTPVFPVKSASGVRVTLVDGRQIIDGMASWWCAIHGYNHPVLNAAMTSQLDDMAHVMFGGFTHRPAVELAELLVQLAPPGLSRVFFSDSGSVSVEVAMKMAVQYWQVLQQPKKQHFLTVKRGYHGDTLGAMSVCDPVTGMHSLFSEMLVPQYFAERPNVRFHDDWDERDCQGLADLFEQHHGEIAALIMEPIVQGAGGMWFYHQQYLKRARELCDEYDVLLILDEIATGFGRTGKMFACEHAAISPDILCVGKALTGGYLSMAATLTSARVAGTVSDNGNGVFMHGPTFMANPLACAVSLSNLRLLDSWPWQQKINAMELQLERELDDCRNYKEVADVRVLGGIGVLELTEPVDMKTAAGEFVRRGVWLRPFGKLVYIMPPYIIDPDDLTCLTSAMHDFVAGL